MHAYKHQCVDTTHVRTYERIRTDLFALGEARDVVELLLRLGRDVGLLQQELCELGLVLPSALGVWLHLCFLFTHTVSYTQRQTDMSHSMCLGLLRPMNERQQKQE